MMSYQGKLTNASGQPAADGAYGMVFTIYDASSTGNSLWTETQPNVQVAGGLFTVMLGSAVPLSETAFQGSSWLQTEVNGTTLTPRVQIVSSGYAIHAKNADTVPDNSISSGKLSSDAASLSKVSGGAMISSGGNVGIGRNDPASPLSFADSLGDKISLWGQGEMHYGFGIQGGLLQIHAGGPGDGIVFGWGSSASFTETMRIKADGKVGIGTNIPEQALSIVGGMNIDQANANNGTLNPGITFGSFSGEGIASKRTLDGNNAGLDFYTNYTNRMSITNAGNVGIGTTDPTGVFQVMSPVSSEARDQECSKDNPQDAVEASDLWQSFTPRIGGLLSAIEVFGDWQSDWYGNLYVHAGEGPTGTLLASQAVSMGAGSPGWRRFNLEDPPQLAAGNKYTYRIQCSDHSNYPAVIYASWGNLYPDGIMGSGIYSEMDWLFRTHMIASGPAFLVHGTTRNVGIGTADPSEKLQVIGNIHATGNISSSSDARFKENIQPLEDALDLVQKLRPVHFDWKRQDFPDKSFAEGQQLGLIAQEVKEILPEVVSQGLDGYHSLDYGRLTTILIGAVKEQQKTIEELRATNASVEARLVALEAKEATD